VSVLGCPPAPSPSSRTLESEQSASVLARAATMTNAPALELLPLTPKDGYRSDLDSTIEPPPSRDDSAVTVTRHGPGTSSSDAPPSLTMAALGRRSSFLHDYAAACDVEGNVNLAASSFGFGSLLACDVPPQAHPSLADCESSSGFSLSLRECR
jgi:hypothetical protein